MIEKYNKFIGYSIDHIDPIIGDSGEAQYIKHYLEVIKASFCLEERNYIDKEFLIDYAMFYARSFDDISKYTTRLHFFKKEIIKSDFFKLLREFNKDKSVKNKLKKLNKDYLGFLIVKPVLGPKNKPMLGRTLLAPYPHRDGDELREHLKQKYPVSLYGLPLEIESLPFQMQDQSVGACATTSCWVSLYPLNKLFGSPIQALAEITERSVTVPSLDRNFPSSGLSLYQIKSYYNSIGLDTEFIKIAPLKKSFGENHTVIPTLTKAYIDFGLPIIADISVCRDPGYIYPHSDCDPHAVVISGYRHKNRIVKELYAHDDGIGPYSRIELTSTRPQNFFISWKCEWLNRIYDSESGEKYKQVQLNSIIIPIYPKLRLRFIDMYVRFLDLIKKSTPLDPNMSQELLLKELNGYKAFLLTKNFLNKREILMRRFPRFLWIVRFYVNNRIVNDKIFDATNNYQTSKPFEDINFK